MKRWQNFEIIWFSDDYNISVKNILSFYTNAVLSCKYYIDTPITVDK